jgi:hypothetical protein
MSTSHDDWELAMLEERARELLVQESRGSVPNPLDTPRSRMIGRILRVALREPSKSPSRLRRAIGDFVRRIRKR